MPLCWPHFHLWSSRVGQSPGAPDPISGMGEGLLQEADGDRGVRHTSLLATPPLPRPWQDVAGAGGSRPCQLTVPCLVPSTASGILQEATRAAAPTAPYPAAGWETAAQGGETPQRPGPRHQMSPGAPIPTPAAPALQWPGPAGWECRPGQRGREKQDRAVPPAEGAAQAFFPPCPSGGVSTLCSSLVWECRVQLPHGCAVLLTAWLSGTQPLRSLSSACTSPAPTSAQPPRHSLVLPSCWPSQSPCSKVPVPRGHPEDIGHSILSSVLE